jgi:hypothetical protein
MRVRCRSARKPYRPQNNGHSVPGGMSRTDEGNEGKAKSGTTLALLQKLNSGTTDGILASGLYPLIQRMPQKSEVIVFLLNHGIYLILRLSSHQSLANGSILEQSGNSRKGSQVCPGTVFRSYQEEK